MKTARTIIPLAAVPKWRHDRTVFSQNVYDSGSLIAQQHNTLTAIPSARSTTDFTISQGDSVLICMACIPAGSGNKLADNLTVQKERRRAVDKENVDAH